MTQPDQDYFIRPLTPADQPLLWEALYLAIHIPAGVTPPPREIVFEPGLAKYVKDWGKPNELGYVALTKATETFIGAAWLRLLTAADRGYGYLDDATPELSISLVEGFRGRGIGRKLLENLLAAAKKEFASVSLSVSIDNPAQQLYRRWGFVEVETLGDSLTMRKYLSDK